VSYDVGGGVVPSALSDGKANVENPRVIAVVIKQTVPRKNNKNNKSYFIAAEFVAEYII